MDINWRKFQDAEVYQWSGHVWKERDNNRDFWINWVERQKLQKLQKSAISNQIARR